MTLLKDVLYFIFELGQLKIVKRTGWWLKGIKDPETVAEHSLRTAQIGYILACLEKYKDPNEVATMGIFHDIAACRILDLHKVTERYVTVSERKSVEDQLEKLPELKTKIMSLWDQVEEKNTTAGIIAKDADILEVAVSAKEYMETGYIEAKDILTNSEKRLRTESGKNLYKVLLISNSKSWWKGLKKF